LPLLRHSNIKSPGVASKLEEQRKDAKYDTILSNRFLSFRDPRNRRIHIGQEGMDRINEIEKRITEVTGEELENQLKS